MSATLYLVSTPIGNLEDITLRALRILRDQVAIIACEDTRQTQKLLDHFEIRKPLVSYHEHNEKTRAPELIDRMQQGESVALVSDAGTPLLSDPGYRLVTAAIEAQIVVVPIPGVSAALTALAASGLPPGNFRFCGFLPPKSGARRRFLEQLKGESATVIVYESPHRILESIEDIASVLGSDCPLVLARELTKVHEEFLRGTAGDVLEDLRSRSSVKGEITLVMGAPNESTTGDPVCEVARLEAAGIERMEAIKAIARQFGVGKRDLYRQVAGEANARPPRAGSR